MQNQGNNKKTETSKSPSLWRVFSDTFFKAEFLLLFFLLVYATVHILQTENTFLGADGKLYSVVPPSALPVESEVLLPESTEGTNADTPQTEEALPAVIKKPETKDEITAYYVAALNRAKTDAAAVTLVQKKSTNYNGVVEAGDNPLLGSLAKSLMKSFLKEENPNTEYTARQDIQSNFIPRGTESHLTKQDVSEASIEEQGDFYILRVKLRPDDNPKAGYGSGAVGSIITKEEIDTAVDGKIKMENVVCAYDGAVSQIKVEKATGNLLEIRSQLPMYLCLRAMGLDCRIGLQFDEYWTVRW